MQIYLLTHTHLSGRRKSLTTSCLTPLQGALLILGLAVRLSAQFSWEVFLMVNSHPFCNHFHLVKQMR